MWLGSDLSGLLSSHSASSLIFFDLLLNFFINLVAINNNVFFKLSGNVLSNSVTKRKFIVYCDVIAFPTQPKRTTLRVTQHFLFYVIPIPHVQQQRNKLHCIRRATLLLLPSSCLMLV